MNKSDKSLILIVTVLCLVACKTVRFSENDSTTTINHNNRERSFLVHAPAHLAGSWQNLPENLVGRTIRDIDACDVIWNFFKKIKHVIADAG